MTNDEIITTVFVLVVTVGSLAFFFGYYMGTTLTIRDQLTRERRKANQTPQHSDPRANAVTELAKSMEHDARIQKIDQTTQQTIKGLSSLHMKFDDLTDDLNNSMSKNVRKSRGNHVVNY